MTDTDAGERARLPKWAQDRIAYLEQALAEQRRLVGRLSEGPADSDVIVHDYVSPPRLLGRGVAIRFLMGDGEYIEVAHHKSGHGYLELRASSGSKDAQSLAVQPQVSNVVSVRLTKHW